MKRLGALAVLLAVGHAQGAAVTPAQASRILSLRNLGLAQLEEEKPRDARATFSKLADLVPGEALPWANGAIAALRDNDVAGAEKLLEKAFAAGGERADLYAIRAAVENTRNRPEAMRAALVRAAALDPRDLESRWRFARSLELEGSSAVADRETRRRFLSEILARSPANLPALLKILLGNLDAGDVTRASERLREVERLLGDADAKAKGYAGEAKALLLKGDVKGASLKTRILENLLRVTPRYLQSLGEVYTNVTGLPLVTFSPGFEADLRPKGSSAIPVSFRESDLAAEDPEAAARRVDLMNTGKAEAYAIPAPFTRAVFFDYDLDGDLDVYLLGGGRPDRLLRNNLDGTFADVTEATGDSAFQSRKALAIDVDRDGDLDLVAIDAGGSLVLRLNQRQGLFRTTPLGVTGVLDITSEDLNGDGFPDIVAATQGGLRLLINKGDGSFSEGADSGLGSGSGPAAMRAVVLADLDNDGFMDIVGFATAPSPAAPAGLCAFRNDGRAHFSEWPVFNTLSKKNLSSDLTASAVHSISLAALDVDGDGDLDLVLSAGGKTRVLLNDGGNANGWLNVVLEGLPTGSGKVNRAGAGSFLEVKAGDLYVARTAGSGPTHFGLGPRAKADVVRCTWTNGVPQNLFDQKARATVKEVQMLKGSCPFVYALNGATGVFSFVSDALGRAPIGLLYDGVHLAGADTREWLFVGGDLLAPTPDGRLVLDYTEELWEAAYLDEATLMAVDHPDGTRIVPNERMVPGILERKLFTVRSPRPVARALSDAGGAPEDVTSALRSLDQVNVDPGPETSYQGVRREHALVLDLGPVAAGDRVVLFLTGWIFYTDTSINVSISQRSDLRHFPPVLEVPDGSGGWKVAVESFGFPAGKTKTMPADLTGLLDPRDPRVRIRTTMAVFWDEAFVTVNDPEVPVATTVLAPAKAVLFERGFSRRYREAPDGPELFAHDDVSTAPAWEDVTGLLTRLGDVTPLLVATDDRWVAFKGGDAIRIEYDATKLPPLREGWRRDYVLVSDGWDKDFDKNTVTGQSYEPWPFHGMSGYPYSASERHPDPEFLREWMRRPVGPDAFRRALSGAAEGSAEGSVAR